MNARVIPFRHPARKPKPATSGPPTDSRDYWKGFYANLDGPGGAGDQDEYMRGFMDAVRIIGDGLAKRDGDHAEAVMHARHRGYAEGYTDGSAEGFRAGRDEQRRWDRRVAQ